MAPPRTFDEAFPPEPWLEPIPLGEATGPVAHFPVEALPAWMQCHVRSVASELQVSVDLPAALALVALSIVFAGRRRIHVRSTWREQLNLYLVVALPPGAGKSPAFRAMLAAIETWEIETAEMLAGQADNVAQKRRMIEKSMKKAEDKGDVMEAMRWLDELQHTPEIVIPRLVADDATPEALVELMARHNGRMALTSTEGGLFELMSGRYSDKANLDVYLKAWSGDAIRVDRIGRGASVIANPTLTIGLTVQPDVIRSLADTPQFAGRGLTARFMFAVPPSKVGYRNLLDIPTSSPDIATDYDARLLGLLRHERSETAPLTTEIDDDACAEFLGWRQGLEERRRPEADLEHLAEWTTKLESSVVRVAGLLALAGGHETVELATMRSGLAIGNYWLAHAKIVHDLWGTDPVVAQARRVLKWAATRELVEFSVRDLHQALRRSDYTTVEETRPPLNLLTERGWIRPLFDGPLVIGRRGVDSPRFAVHPSNLWTSTSVEDDEDDEPRGVKTNISLSLSTSKEARHMTNDPHGPQGQNGHNGTTSAKPPLAVKARDPEFGEYR